MMELTKISKLIYTKIEQLEAGRKTLKERGESKSLATAEYEKKLAITIIRLKNGESLDIEAYKIENPPATLTEKIAKGICWNEKLEMDKSEALYKAALVNMQSFTAALSALQSILKYSEEK